MKNSYQFDYEEYLEFYNKVIKNSKEYVNINENQCKKFNTDKEVVEFYDAMLLDDYILSLQFLQRLSLCSHKELYLR